jgi:hypothetical protein
LKHSEKSTPTETEFSPKKSSKTVKQPLTLLGYKIASGIGITNSELDVLIKKVDANSNGLINYKGTPKPNLKSSWLPLWTGAQC